MTHDILSSVADPDWIRIQSGQFSVVDPDSLSMDPDSNADPAFQVNRDLDTGF
jgi:hypothetical protein